MKQKRILLVDDNEQIHKDFYNILSTYKADDILHEDEQVLFDLKEKPSNGHSYRIDSAFQGQEALEMVKKAHAEEDPYALAFIDIRMPPGWDGIETIKRLWAIDPAIQVVICSAYSDHSWDDISHELGDSDNLLILKKPFEIIEISQFALALTKKWELLANLHSLIGKRTVQLERLNSLTNAALEAIEEGLIAIGLDNNIILYNHTFIKLWQIDTKESFYKADALFKFLSYQVEDSDLFYKSMMRLLDKPASSRKEWHLKSGATFSLYAHPQYLKDQIIGMVYSFQNITESKALEKQLLHQATHDILTDLPNRALLLDRIKQALNHAKRFNLNVGVLLLDLDSFKEVNDTLGHKAGDILLKYVAQVLSSFVRENDTVARLGGDEFVLTLLSKSNTNNFENLLDKIIKKLSEPYYIDDQEVILTASIGVSIYPQDGMDADVLLKNADSALYHAKQLGRNQFQFYQDEFNKNMTQRSELKLALTQAIAKDELFLCYQPLVDLKNGKIIGMEALLRWQHPTLGLLSPLKFISIAEESGLIISIGEWVLKTACLQMKKWHEITSFHDLKISVNVSVKQFRQKSFVNLVKKVLKETQLEPKFLELEITESLILGNVSDVINQMVALKKLGVRFAMDDFGTGYSSLSYLKNFPFDTVKIDKTFLDDITTDDNNASIVEAIITMTRNMGIDVLAEGVENIDQVNFLRAHHSNQVQGYYFSKPLTEVDCTELLNKKMRYKEI